MVKRNFVACMSLGTTRNAATSSAGTRFTLSAPLTLASPSTERRTPSASSPVRFVTRVVRPTSHAHSGVYLTARFSARMPRTSPPIPAAPARPPITHASHPYHSMRTSVLAPAQLAEVTT